MGKYQTYLVRFLFCLLLALRSESRDSSSFALSEADLTVAESESCSTGLELDRLPSPIAGAGDEMRDGSRGASVMMTEIHNIQVL
jgi:hypothetical protein